MQKFHFACGNSTSVSDEDYWYLSQWIWRISNFKGFKYVSRCEQCNGKPCTIYMHLEVAERMGLNLSNRIDHRDRDTLNNQRENLRPATFSQNAINGGSFSNNTSGYRGVDFHKKRNKFRARITYNGKSVDLGYFKTEEEASIAYQAAAKRYFGDFAPKE